MSQIESLNIQYIPDFDLNSSYEDIDEFQKELSTEEEGILQEILTLEKNAKVSTNFMSDLLEAVKKGSLDYIDSMTDTTDPISSLKRSDSVRQWDDTEIEPINTSADKSEADAFKPRTMEEANQSALRNTSTDATKGCLSLEKNYLQSMKKHITNVQKVLTSYQKMATLSTEAM